MSRQDLMHAGSVLWQLTLRELRVRYKQSLLGVVWALLVPLALLITLSLVFSRWTRLADLMDPAMPYPLFVGIGLIPWLFHAQCLTQAVNSLVANRNLVTKIYFSREVFPFSAVLCALFDALMAIPVVVGLCWWYGAGQGIELLVGGGFGTVVKIIAVVLVQLMFTSGLALGLSCANLFYRDVKHILPIGLQIWMLGSNVMVPLPASSPEAAAWSCLNPMIPILSAYRSIVWRGTLEPGIAFPTAVVMSMLVFTGGWLLFRYSEPRFAEAV